MRTVQVNHCLLCAELELPEVMRTTGGLQLGDSRSKESSFDFFFRIVSSGTRIPLQLDGGAVATHEVAHLELARDPVPCQDQLEVGQLKLVDEVCRMTLQHMVVRSAVKLHNF